MSAQHTWPERAATRARNRQAFLDAASAMLANHGYAAISLSALAARAGLSTGAVYTIFGSKAELFLELLRDGAQPPPFDEDEAATLEDALRSYGERWADRINAPDARKMLELSFELQLAALREDSLLTRILEAQHQETAHFAAQLSAAAEVRGEHFTEPVERLAATIISALQGLTGRTLLVGRDADPHHFGTVVLQLAQRRPASP